MFSGSKAGIYVIQLVYYPYSQQDKEITTGK